MVTTIANFGDSIGIQIPKSFLKNVQFFENDDVEIIVEDNSIIVKRQEERKHLTTKERIASFCEKIENIQPFEIDWGKPQGKELW
jgi:antitoxin MazE